MKRTPKFTRIRNSLFLFGILGGFVGLFGYRWYVWPLELIPVDDWDVWVDYGISGGVGILIGCVIGLVVGCFKISEHFIVSGDDINSQSDGE